VSFEGMGNMGNMGGQHAHQILKLTFDMVVEAKKNKGPAIEAQRKFVAKMSSMHEAGELVNITSYMPVVSVKPYMQCTVEDKTHAMVVTGISNGSFRVTGQRRPLVRGMRCTIRGAVVMKAGREKWGTHKEFSDGRFPVVELPCGGLCVLEPMQRTVSFEGQDLVLMQVPMRPAFASTFNKAQGVTADIVEWDMNEAFDPTMNYMAASRVPRRAGLRIINLDVDKFVTSSKSQDFLDMVGAHRTKVATAVGRITALMAGSAEGEAPASPMMAGKGSAKVSCDGKRVRVMDETPVEDGCGAPVPPHGLDQGTVRRVGQTMGQRLDLGDGQLLLASAEGATARHEARQLSRLDVSLEQQLRHKQHSIVDLCSDTSDDDGDAGNKAGAYCKVKIEDEETQESTMSCKLKGTVDLCSNESDEDVGLCNNKGDGDMAWCSAMVIEVEDCSDSQRTLTDTEGDD
jgi:hypothetical protein